MNTMKQLQQLFPSVDGNKEQRQELIHYLSEVVTKIDSLKDPTKLSLGNIPNYTKNYYNELAQKAIIPDKGLTIEETIDELISLVEGQRYINQNYVANAAPLPNIASIIGNLVMVLVNGNNIWDVEGSAAASAEVKISSMLSKMIGYDPDQSSGYTTWGGQGAVFNSLRLAISRSYPESNHTGIPNNLYVFCSELSHYSLYKSVEATGIGVDHLVRVKVNDDHSMNLVDLKEKMEKVISKGGIPIYVLASMGTTDTFGIDDLEGIKSITREIEENYSLPPIYIHGDTAMGGMYSFFNDYDFEANPLMFEQEVLEVLKTYQQKFNNLHLADSMVFDFHKLGSTPYTSSLFLIKDRNLLKYVDLDATETPYVGNRGYGSYHTSYTLECSRMGSAIGIYASILALGKAGYQQLLANYIRVNILFRKKLIEKITNVAITNKISPVTTFRFYPETVCWEEELKGKLNAEEINRINRFNEDFAELIGLERETIFFGNTSRQRYIQPADHENKLPVYAHKFFSISPYTTVEEIDRYVNFLNEHMEVYKKSNQLVLI